MELSPVFKDINKLKTDTTRIMGVLTSAKFPTCEEELNNHLIETWWYMLFISAFRRQRQVVQGQPGLQIEIMDSQVQAVKETIKVRKLVTL